MVITRSGLFTLETSNPRFFTCCAKVHVKVALAFIIVFLGLVELAEWYMYIFIDETGETTDAGEAILSLWQLVALILMGVSFFTEQEHLLIPFILFMIFVVSSFGFWVMQTLVIALFPYSDRAIHLFGFSDTVPLLLREKIIMTVLAFFTTLTTMTGWFLHVGLTCYVYFQSRNREQLVNVSARNARPPMVSEVKTQNAKPDDKSFPNPNFSISDDEDHDEEEDKVFERKPGPSMV